MAISLPFVNKNSAKSRLSAKERVQRAEDAFLSMYEERKKLEQLILDACIKLRGMGFVEPTSNMKLENAQAFKDIMEFAKGAPQLHVPLLDSLDPDGHRYVKRYRMIENVGHEIQLECGHTIRLRLDEKPPEKNQRVECARCIAMLKERSRLEEKSSRS